MKHGKSMSIMKGSPPFLYTSPFGHISFKASNDVRMIHSNIFMDISKDNHIHDDMFHMVKGCKVR